MILPDKFLEEVTKFCEIHQIPIKNGKILQEHIREIETYIAERLKKERDITRRLEEQYKNSISSMVHEILFKVKPEDSPIEEYLWQALQREELSFLAVRQFEIGLYRIDFAFPKYKLAVECDGKKYHRENQQQLERDQKRDKFLARKGWRTLRVEGLAIRRDINYCIKRIKEAIGQKID